ncbi:MAG: PP2C family protein-serine/threonine phosphatase [Acidimicrobiales bacterium]
MGRADVVSELLRRASVAAPDMLTAEIAMALHDIGGNHLVLYVVDYDQETLRPVALASDLLSEPPPPVAIAGTMAGRVFQTQETLSAESPGDGSVGGWRVWAPVRERAERIGVLEFGFVALDGEILRLCDDLGRLVGHLVRTSSRYTDLIEMRRRRQPMKLAAEMQWDLLLPPMVFRSPDVCIAGHVEPAYDIGGDGFDYSLNGEVLDFVLFDAMGHGVRAALLSSLALAGLRHARRRNLDPLETVALIDAAIVDEFDGDGFVTGHLARLDTVSGRLSWINVGHPDFLLVRGGKVVAEPHCEPCLPLGLGGQVTEIGECQLEPGDILAFYSDGVVEAHPTGGEQFGLDCLKERLSVHMAGGRSASETLRRVVADVVAHRADELQDDATLVLVEWRPYR